MLYSTSYTGGVQVSDAPYTVQIYLRKKAKGDNSKYFACVLCISDTVDEDDDLYDFVEDEENEGDEIYEDLMRADEPPETVSGSHVTYNLQQKGGCSPSLAACKLCRSSNKVLLLYNLGFTVFLITSCEAMTREAE